MEGLGGAGEEGWGGEVAGVQKLRWCDEIRGWVGRCKDGEE